MSSFYTNIDLNKVSKQTIQEWKNDGTSLVFTLLFCYVFERFFASTSLFTNVYKY